MTLKVMLLSICLLGGFSLATKAQSKNYLGLEVFGNTGSYYSFNFVKDFVEADRKSFLSYRAGLSILPAQQGFSERYTEFYFPLSVHYTIWKHLEFGMGVTPYIERDLEFSDNGEFSEKAFLRTIVIPSIGYRNDIKEQWFFKVTFTPLHYTAPDNNDLFNAFIGLMLAKRIGG
ncbi:MAG: hypothetical protein RIF33_17885 [Cyclobacteriaceae bacterium]